MKFTLSADLHYDLFQNISLLEDDLLTCRAKEIDKVFKDIIDRTCGLGIQHHFVIGDALHKRNIRSDAVNTLLYTRLKYAKSKGLKVYLIVGNHDQAHVAGQVHAFGTFHDVATVIDTPQVITLDGIDFYCLPYEEYKGSKKSIELLLKNKNPNRVLLAHVGIKDASLSGFDHVSKEPLSLDDLQVDKFLYSYFGHYHLPQKLGKNAMYVGSPCQHSLSDKLVERGFVEVELVLDKKWKAVNTRHVVESPTFREVKAKEYVASQFEGKHYIKVTDCNRNQVEALQEDSNVMSTTGVKAEVVVDENKVIQPELGWDEMVDKYVSITEPNLRKHRRLKKIGKGFLE